MIFFPRIPPGEPVVLSATTYVTYLRCPQSALARLRGFYAPDSVRSFRGGLAHRVFARHLDEGPISDAELNQVCREEIGRGGLNEQISALGLTPSRLNGVIHEVGDIYQRFKILPRDGVEAVEEPIEVEPRPGVTLRGLIDAVFGDDGNIRLVDWKTGALGGAEAQLDFYALLWALHRGELPAQVEAVSVTTGERHTASPTLDDVERTAGRVANIVAELREAFVADADLERRGGEWCRFCPVLEGCSEGNAAVKIFGP